MPIPDDSSAALIEGVRRGDRRALARAITLMESTLTRHCAVSAQVLDAVLPATGHALRIAISGTPGAGKSTLIEALGRHVITLGRKPAVLAIDPSSTVSGGAILGDKTRMERLAASPEAFVRPSPSAGRLGGVAARTRETILLCEAAGFDVIIVETVGTGQSETTAASMTDVFVYLQVPGAGDELQAMKKGALELADIVVVNKSDVDPAAAERAARYVSGGTGGTGSAGGAGNGADRDHPPRSVMLTSALTGAGVDALWQSIVQLQDVRQANGTFVERRREQSRRWIWDRLEDDLLAELRQDTQLRETLRRLADEVAGGKLSTAQAAQRLLSMFRRQT